MATVNLQKTSASKPKSINYEIIGGRKNVIRKENKIFKTPSRAQIGHQTSILPSLDDLPLIDRSLIDYTKYHKYVGHAGRKYSMAMQATRGCPYKCFYCDIYKTTINHYRRSVDSIVEEVKILYDMGIRRIEFIDDIFNVNVKHCASFFNSVKKAGMDIEFMFPNGLKGDLFTKELLDIMIDGGLGGMNLSLEHASPRMQKVMRKNLDVEKFRENIQYVATNYPSVVVGLYTMHGFPTETEDEAHETLNFIKSIKWVHFPYMFNVRVFPGTEIEHFALEQGISKKVIEDSQDMSYAEGSPTIAFSKEFTTMIRARFIKEYMLNKERLLKVLPHQMKRFTEDELDQKYKAYFPSTINSLNDLLNVVGIKRAELEVKECLDEKKIEIPNLKSKIEKHFPPKKKDKDSLKFLLIDLSTYYMKDWDNREYNVIEPPLGLMALMSYINKQDIANKIDNKMIKSFIDFNSNDELVELIKDYNPDVIGVRAMTFYRNFFHDAINHIRKKGISTPIIVGGPYPTASYTEVLKDKNIDVVVIAEGEITITDILKRTLNNNKRFPNKEELKDVPGIAFLRN
tara:strand:+ start:7060 stop:8772 length:1713 start_codon:yes stop_codon:yes gene_type:complete